jgi:sugar lactone lactonase YvrE
MQSNLNPDGSSKAITQHLGALYRVDPDGTATRWSENEFGISNTMAWTADGSTFYFGDTLEQTLYAFDFDTEAGAVSNRRLFAVTKEHGLPDGSCIDEEGYIWNARFAGGCLLRYAPNGGIDRVMDLPVSNPTSCTFGGPDRRTLFVTSARLHLSDTRLRTEPREGALLALDVGVGGPPDHYFAG